jgi:hypothetical protein
VKSGLSGSSQFEGTSGTTITATFIFGIGSNLRTKNTVSLASPRDKGMSKRMKLIMCDELL